MPVVSYLFQFQMIPQCWPENQSYETNDHTSSLITGTNSETVCEYKSGVGRGLFIYFSFALTEVWMSSKKKPLRDKGLQKNWSLKSKHWKSIMCQKYFAWGEQENVPWKLHNFFFLQMASLAAFSVDCEGYIGRWGHKHPVKQHTKRKF